MKCIYCFKGTKVVNSRHSKRNNTTWRRRNCLACGAVFTSREEADLSKGLIVISNGIVEAFHRDKLFISIYESLKHRKTAHIDATGLTDTIISKFYPLISVGSIDKKDIRSVVLGVLKHFDKAAHTHYSAYYGDSL